MKPALEKRNREIFLLSCSIVLLLVVSVAVIESTKTNIIGFAGKDSRTLINADIYSAKGEENILIGLAYQIIAQQNPIGSFLISQIQTTGSEQGMLNAN